MRSLGAFNQTYRKSLHNAPRDQESRDQIYRLFQNDYGKNRCNFEREVVSVRKTKLDFRSLNPDLSTFADKNHYESCFEEEVVVVVDQLETT